MTKSKKKSDAFWRVVISAVGVALIAMAVGNIILFIFGTRTSASVSVRRFGGADNGRPSEIRYSWSVDYTFIDDEGERHEGHSTKLGGDMSVKTDDTVYYLKAAPFINGLESEVEPNLGQLIYVCLGVFLIYVMNPRLKRKKNKKKPTT